MTGMNPSSRPVCRPFMLHLLNGILMLALATGAASAQDSGFRPNPRTAPAPAADTASPVPAQAPAPAARESAPDDALPGEVREGKCTFGCLRWTQMCNVDPRGVYRCQRGCARMGEVCQ